MARNPTPRTNGPKPAAGKQGVKTGEALTRAISGNTIVDSSLRPGAPDGASAAPGNAEGAAAAQPAPPRAAPTPASATAQGSSQTPRETSALKSAQSSGQTSAQEASRYERIARGAYFRAEARGFTPGYELEDWLAAERELGDRAGEGVIG
jgi:hypothetical protein